MRHGRVAGTDESTVLEALEVVEVKYDPIPIRTGKLPMLTRPREFRIFGLAKP